MAQAQVLSGQGLETSPERVRLILGPGNMTGKSSSFISTCNSCHGCKRGIKKEQECHLYVLNSVFNQLEPALLHLAAIFHAYLKYQY